MLTKHETALFPGVKMTVDGDSAIHTMRRSNRSVLAGQSVSNIGPIPSLSAKDVVITTVGSEGSQFLGSRVKVELAK